MGRMQMKGKGKGISGSALPYKRKAPKWVTLTPSAVTDIIVKLAKKGKLQYSRSCSILNRCSFKRSTWYPLSEIYHWQENLESFEEEWYSFSK